MKKLIALASFAFVSAVAFAQTREEAITKTLNERYESAAADFRKLIAQNPANGEMYFYAGDNYFYWGVLDSAEMMFRKGIEVAPLNPMNFAGLGRVGWVNNNDALNSAQYQKAIEIMSAKSNKIDKNVQLITYMKMAETYVQGERKKFDKALEYLNTALKFNDQDPEMYVQLGDYYFQSELEKNGKTGMLNLSLAQSQYSKAAQLNPKYTRALLAQGKLLVPARNWEDALKFFNDAIAIDPNYAPAYREKAELLYKAGRFPLAVENYSKYLELNNSCRVQQRYASFVFETKDYKKAVVELEKALPCNNQNPFMYRLLGYSYYETGDFAKGLENINKFMDMATAQGSPKILGSDYAYKGKLLAKSGQDSLGVATILRAIELDPEYIEGYSDIAGIYSKAKRYADAANFYERKISAAGEKATALDFYYLGQAQYFAKEYAKADAAFEKASAKYPDANFWRGRCNFKLDNQETPEGLATPHFTKFIELVGGDAAAVQANKKNLIESYSYLGFFYYTKQNFACSKAAWLSVQVLEATNEKASIALTDKDIAAAVETGCTEFKTQTPQ